MIWANSESTPDGSLLRKIINDKVRCFLKTKHGAIELDKYEYERLRRSEIDEWFIAERQGIGDDVVTMVNPLGGSKRDVSVDGDGGNAGSSYRKSEQIERDESISDGRRSMEGVREGSFESAGSSEFQDNGSGHKFSRQRLSDSRDEIRDMMNLYEVHDEVITAVEEHIEKIKSRQLSRETAITEGLIPK